MPEGPRDWEEATTDTIGLGALGSQEEQNRTSLVQGFSGVFREKGVDQYFTACSFQHAWA